MIQARPQERQDQLELRQTNIATVYTTPSSEACYVEKITISRFVPTHACLSWLSIVLIGYYGYHPVTTLPKIGSCDFFSNAPNVLLVLYNYLPVTIIGL